MNFNFRHLSIQGIILVETKKYKDNRGFFTEIFKRSEFSNHGIRNSFLQDNYSHSQKGTIRGLHYQLSPQQQGKLVITLFGSIFAVAVDIRYGSPTYGQWVGIELSGRNGYILYIPPGFAHGFCVISETANVLYKVTSEYAPKLERGIIWNDPQIGINWPVNSPVLSTKDTQLPLLKHAEKNFIFYNEE